MRKTAFIAAAAIAFDLGVMVVACQAADDHIPFKFDKIAKAPSQARIFIKFDLVNTPQSCMTKGGMPTTQHGVQGCLLPATAESSSPIPTDR